MTTYINAATEADFEEMEQDREWWHIEYQCEEYDALHADEE